jgi:transcriptional regulator with XRE-family HTH domain
MEQENQPLPFGAYLKSLRRQRHLTQIELSRRARVAQSYLSALERGAVVNPSQVIIRRLAGALRIRAEELAANSELIGLDSVTVPDPGLTELMRCWLELTPAKRSFLLWIVHTIADHQPASCGESPTVVLGEPHATHWTDPVAARNSGSIDRI